MPLVVSSPAGSSGPKTQWVTLVSGIEVADQAVFAALGAHPTIDEATLGPGSKSYVLQVVLNVPVGSSAEFQLYDITNHVAIVGAVVPGLAAQVQVDLPFVLGAGPHELEFDMLTNPAAGGNANVQAAGVLVTWA